MDKNKDKALLTLILTVLFGWFGYYRLSKNQIGLFVLWLLTCGLFGIGWIVDIIFALIDYLNAPKITNITQKANFDQNNNNQLLKASTIPPNCYLYKKYDNVELFCEGDKETDFKEIKIGETIRFMQDEYNIHDSETVEVYNSEYEFAGYMYNNRLRSMVNDFLDIYSGGLVTGEISSINEAEKKVSLTLYFYKIKDTPVNQVKKSQPNVWLLNPSNKKVHCLGCRTLKNASGIQRCTDLSSARRKGYTACGVCKPF